VNKRYIWFLVGLMSVALFGLIAVQYNWIRNAILVEKNKFDLLVEKSLSEIVDKVAEHETVLNLHLETTSFSDKNDTYKLSEHVNNQLFDSSNHLFTRPQFYIVSADSSYFRIKKEIDSDSVGEKKIISKEELRANLLNKITNKSIFVENIVNKLTRKEINLEERIDQETLSVIIKNVLKNNNIDRAYEYAVVKEDNTGFFKSANFDLSHNPRRYEKLLFSDDLLVNDILEDNYHLLLYFHKPADVLGSLPAIVLTSVVLTLVILGIFMLNIFIIFKQKKLSEIKNDFINNMTHELKTPISTISLASQMLIDQSLSDNEKNFGMISNIISDESKRLGYHVEKVLQMAIIDKGGIRMLYKPINVHHLINTLIVNMDLKIKDKNGILKSTLEAGKDEVLADELHLTNVFTNLLDNAIKYTKSDPYIQLQTRNVNGHIVVSVKDNGIGIKKENQKKIFEKFYRVPTGNVHDVRGFGLGLSYVKEIVEQHKGRIMLNSESGKGSMFEVFIPLIKTK
jgi:two-component system, OmpR family, phosphate regulon sensor histidine kinase PhoR